MRRDRLALFLSVVVPMIAFAVLALTFSNAVIRNLRVSIVDADRSATSLTYVQAIGSAPGVSVAERSGDMTGAMHAIRSGAAIAAIYIPQNFERDLIDRKRPQIVVLYNRQYFTPGNKPPPRPSRTRSPRRRRRCREPAGRRRLRARRRLLSSNMSSPIRR